MILGKFPLTRQPNIAFRKRKKEAIFFNNVTLLQNLCRAQKSLRPKDDLPTMYCYLAIEKDNPELYQVLIDNGHPCGQCPALVAKYLERTSMNTRRYAKMYKYLYSA